MTFLQVKIFQQAAFAYFPPENDRMPWCGANRNDAQRTQTKRNEPQRSETNTGEAERSETKPPGPASVAGFYCRKMAGFQFFRLSAAMNRQGYF